MRDKVFGWRPGRKRRPVPATSASIAPASRVDPVGAEVDEILTTPEPEQGRVPAYEVPAPRDSSAAVDTTDAPDDDASPDDARDRAPAHAAAGEGGGHRTDAGGDI
jgi:hypothetical protein